MNKIHATIVTQGGK